VRRSPRVLLTWIAAALLAHGTARVVATDLAVLHRRARALDVVAHVVVARHDLPLGAVIDARDLRTIETAGDLAGRALTDTGSAVGHVVVVPVVAGAPLFSAHVAPSRRDPLGAVVPRGMRVVHVAAESGLRPAPGAVVDVLATFDPTILVGEGGGEPTLTVAQAATVLATTNSAVETRVDDPTERGITLLVTEDEAHRLAFASANGVLTIALAPPEDACCKPSSSASSRD
jgi:Flp pilus assembly protein CpaB